MRWSRVAVLVALALPASCGSPLPTLYTLAALPGPVVTGAARSVELRRIGLAGYLDRPEIVRSAAEYHLTVLLNDRWGEPMGSMLGRVLTEDLVERLPQTAVFSESGAISTQPDLVLEIDVQRFDTDADGTVVLLAQVAVRHDAVTRPSSARTYRLTLRPRSPSTTDLVAAMSAVLGQFADRVAGELRA
jgi:uncharacterized lipoprotein YmbA